MILFSRLLVRRLFLTDRGAHRIFSREGHRRGKGSVLGVHHGECGAYKGGLGA